MNNVKQKKIPQRMCVACRQMFDKGKLLRIVKTPEGTVKVDPTGKANGRGAYVCSDVNCVNKCAKGLLSKHFECQIPPEIYEEIKAYRSAKD